MNFLKNSGVVSMVVASAIFSFSSLLVKFCLKHFSSMELVFARSFLGFLYFLVYFRVRGIRMLGGRRGILLLRGFFGFCGLSMYFFTVGRIELASAVVLNRLSPLLLIILSAYLLHERVDARHFLLGGLAFAGVILIAKPGTDVMETAALAGVGSALASALAYITVKKASATEHVSVIVFYFFWVASLLSAPFAFMEFGLRWREQLSLPFSVYAAVFGMAALSVTAQLFMTRSYRLSQASKAGLVTYVSVFLSALLGWWFFSEIPDVWSVAGGVMILIATGLVGTLREREAR